MNLCGMLGTVISLGTSGYASAVVSNMTLRTEQATSSEHVSEIRTSRHHLKISIYS